MRITIFGLGYVGTVCACCLARHGHKILGVDIQPSKVESVNQGQAPVIEPGLQDLLSTVVESGHFRATTNIAEAMRDAEVVLLCVGTPSQRDGSLNLTYLETVVRQVGENLAPAAEFPVIAIRSTVPPGTLSRCSKILADASRSVPGEDFGVVSNPEFLREGSALVDFENPPYTLVGTDHPRALPIMERMYEALQTPFMATSTGAAEIIKYVNNSFHALKIAFANEVGVLCKSLAIDSHEVMDLVCADKKLNISPVYLKPGFAYGGSCLPKDLEALNQTARLNGLKLPVLGHIADSNAEHLNHSIRIVEDAGNRNLGFLGLSFKAQTDDLRESPAVKVVETLLGRGYNIKIYDPNLNLSRLIGANREYIENRIRHLSELLVSSVDELLGFAETVVVTNDDASYRDILDRASDEHIVVDMTRLPDCPTVSGGGYRGICW